MNIRKKYFFKVTVQSVLHFPIIATTAARWRSRGAHVTGLLWLVYMSKFN